jgi:hypothetical protein
LTEWRFVDLIKPQDVNELENLRALNAALTKRVAFLEWRLSQREVATKKDFSTLKPWIDSVKLKILAIFNEEIPVTQGLTYPEIQNLYAQKYPRSSTTDVPRRVRDLVNDGKLWRCDDEDGTVRFYLKLKEEAEEAVEQ